MSDLLLQAIFYGVVLGGLYALVALGLNLIYGVLNVVNFAHGASMMLAMYVTYWLWALYHIDPYISLAIVMPIMFLLGFGIQRFLLQPLAGSPGNQFLTTLGLLIIFQNGAQILWTADFRTVTTGYSNATLSLGPVILLVARVAALGVAIVMAAVLFFVLTRTDLGRAMQAASQDAVGAAASGIDVTRIYAITFGIGLAAVGAAGAVVIPFFYATPTVGDTFNIPAFIVVILGGLGSMPGAVVGGLIVGLVDSVGAAMLPGSLGQVVLLVIFLAALMLRPAGLFGRRLV